MKPETLAKKLVRIGIEASEKCLGRKGTMMSWNEYQPHLKAGHIAVAKWHLDQMSKKQKRRSKSQ